MTGGGLLDLSAEPAESRLLAKGAAMASAVAEDLLTAGHQVTMLVDGRIELPEFNRLAGQGVQLVPSAGCDWSVNGFDRNVVQADASVLIAPETDGHLLSFTKRSESLAAKLICPSSGFVGLASDKGSTAKRLHDAGVSVPAGVNLGCDESLPASFTYPAVLKPVDGAGAVETWRVDSPADFPEVDKHVPRRVSRRIETWHDGVPASASLLCGPGGMVSLPPTRQRISEGPKIEYQGGEGPLTGELAKRAASLARRAVEALPPAVGYVGVDLVLGETDADDVVIEVNPRVSVSYVGLRQMLAENLGDLMVRVALGEKVETPVAVNRVRFQPDGTITECERL